MFTTFLIFNVIINYFVVFELEIRYSDITTGGKVRMPPTDMQTRQFKLIPLF